MRLALGVLEDQAAPDEQAAQGDDERRHADVGDDEALDAAESAPSTSPIATVTIQVAGLLEAEPERRRDPDRSGSWPSCSRRSRAIEPTDRSMLRDTMISTMPVAMIAIDALWTDRFQRLRGGEEAAVRDDVEADPDDAQGHEHARAAACRCPAALIADARCCAAAAARPSGCPGGSVASVIASSSMTVRMRAPCAAEDRGRRAHVSSVSRAGLRAAVDRCRPRRPGTASSSSIHSASSDDTAGCPG